MGESNSNKKIIIAIIIVALVGILSVAGLIVLVFSKAYSKSKEDYTFTNPQTQELYANVEGYNRAEIEIAGVSFLYPEYYVENEISESEYIYFNVETEKYVYVYVTNEVSEVETVRKMKGFGLYYNNSNTKKSVEHYKNMEISGYPTYAVYNQHIYKDGTEEYDLNYYIYVDEELALKVSANFDDETEFRTVVGSLTVD